MHDECAGRVYEMEYLQFSFVSLFLPLLDGASL